MKHLDKYTLVKQAYLQKFAGIGDWMPDNTFQTSASNSLGTDVGNFFKGIGNIIVDPITGLLSGDPKKMVGGAAFTALNFVPGGRAVAGMTQAGRTTAKGMSMMGKGSQIAKLKEGVGFGSALANSYKFWKPGWGKGMVHGWAGNPLGLAVLGLGGGLNAYAGRQGGVGGDAEGGFGPNVLASAAQGLASLLGGGGGGGAAAGGWMPGAGSGLQTERMGQAAY